MYKRSLYISGRSGIYIDEQPHVGALQIAKKPKKHIPV